MAVSCELVVRSIYSISSTHGTDWPSAVCAVRNGRLDLLLVIRQLMMAMAIPSRLSKGPRRQ